MRLGIDASNLRKGGGITHLIELIRAGWPESAGIRKVIVWGGQDTLTRIPSRPWLRLVYDPLLDRSLPWRLFWQICRLPELAKHACDILFTPGATNIHTRVPYVTMCQNMLPFEPFERSRFGWSKMGVRLRLLEYSQRRSFQRADGVIFLTRYAQRIVEKRIGVLHARQAIIPHGIAREFRFVPRAAHALDFYTVKRPFRIIYVSTIAAYKHQWKVAEAVYKLRRTGIPLVLYLIGSFYRTALRRLNDELDRVDPKCEFIQYVGPVNYSELPSWYNMADAFIFASSCENLPIILLEAMAAGLPIACSDLGPMPELLGQAGIYFNPENENSIEAALRTLLFDPKLRNQIALMAFEKSRIYTWEECAKQTFEFIHNIGNRL